MWQKNKNIPHKSPNSDKKPRMIGRSARAASQSFRSLYNLLPNIINPLSQPRLYLISHHTQLALLLLRFNRRSVPHKHPAYLRSSFAYRNTPCPSFNSVYFTVNKQNNTSKYPSASGEERNEIQVWYLTPLSKAFINQNQDRKYNCVRNPEGSRLIMWYKCDRNDYFWYETYRYAVQVDLKVFFF